MFNSGEHLGILPGRKFMLFLLQIVIPWMVCLL